MYREMEGVIGVIALAWVLTQWAEFIAEKYNKHFIMNYVCLKCYSFWLGFGLFTYQYGLKGILYASVCGLGGYILERIFLRW